MEEVYISQRDESKDLYHQLQQDTLERLQRLTGDIWTDYNSHDPGMTICDVLNYGLTELDYRLRFDFPDYLVGDNPAFQPRAYGLYDAAEVFPVAPVTPEDYRKLIIDAVEEVENAWIYPAEERPEGWYEILVELLPETGAECQEKVRQQIEALYEANRNLGEGLYRVVFIERQPLVLQGEIEIAGQEEPTRLFAAIYWEALQFFVSSVRYQRIETLLDQGKTPDEILEGPCLKAGVTEPDCLRPVPCAYAVSRLYRRLKSLPGVKNIRSLGFTDGRQQWPDMIVTGRSDRSYTVCLPQRPEESQLRLYMGHTLAEIHWSELPRLFYACRTRQEEHTPPLSGRLQERNLPQGKLREIYTHDSIQNDFPECYGINRMGVAAHEPEHRKAQAAQLKAFLLLADEVFARGLRELQHIPQVLGISEAAGKEGICRLTDPVVAWTELVDDSRVKPLKKDRQQKQRKLWADQLDRLYGEDSRPLLLQVYNFYEEDEGEETERRCRFLQQVPEWGYHRMKGVNLKDPRPENYPGIKAYVAALLGVASEEERPVVNIFPFYNLRLLEDDRFYRLPGQLLSSHLLPEEQLREEYMDSIPWTGKEYGEEAFRLLQKSLPLLHYHLLFEGLVQGGIRRENYRMLHLPGQSGRLLVFYHLQRRQWINLGRFATVKELADAASCLYQFLLMINRKSETLYVVEHLYFQPAEAFTLTVVFPGWSARMADAGFREACEELVCSRLPAHFKVNFCWLGFERMWKFEQAYYEWRRARAAGNEGYEAANRLKETIR